MQSIGKPIGLEKGSTNLGEAQFDQTIRQVLQFFLSAISLWLGLKRPCEQLDEGCETELIHVVHFHQIAEHDEEVRTNMSKVFVYISLFIQGLTEVLRLSEGSLNLRTLNLSLVQTVNKRGVL